MPGRAGLGSALRRRPRCKVGVKSRPNLTLFEARIWAHFYEAIADISASAKARCIRVCGAYQATGGTRKGVRCEKQARIGLKGRSLYPSDDRSHVKDCFSNTCQGLARTRHRLSRPANSASSHPAQINRARTVSHRGGQLHLPRFGIVSVSENSLNRCGAWAVLRSGFRLSIHMAALMTIS